MLRAFLIVYLYIFPSYAGVWEELSKVAYDIAGPECKDPTIDLTRAQQALNNVGGVCGPAEGAPLSLASTKSLASAAKVTQTDIENTCLSGLANQQAKELLCASDFAKNLPQAPEYNEIIKRVKTLREARQKLQAAMATFNSEEFTRGRLCPADKEDLQANSMMVQARGFDPYEKYCREIIESRAAVNTLVQSIPLSGTKSVLEYIDHYSAVQGPEADQMEKIW